MKINIPLLALAFGAFGIGVTEFSPMGMLPIIANDLAVSIPTAGMLISAYAFGVLIGAPFMTLVFANMSRRNLLLLSMAIFTIGNLISAWRIVTTCCCLAVLSRHLIMEHFLAWEPLLP